MHDVEVLSHKLGRRISEDVPGVHAHVGRQLGLVPDLVQADVEAVEFCRPRQGASKVVEPDPAAGNGSVSVFFLV